MPPKRVIYVLLYLYLEYNHLFPHFTFNCLPDESDSEARSSVALVWVNSSRYVWLCNRR